MLQLGGPELGSSEGPIRLPGSMLRNGRSCFNQSSRFLSSKVLDYFRVCVALP